MEILITGHHMTVTTAIREHINKRLKKIENHFSQPTTIDVVLNKEKSSYQSEATIHGKKVSIHAKSVGNDMFSAIDSMSRKLDRQVVKHKEKLTNHGRHNDRQKSIGINDD